MDRVEFFNKSWVCGDGCCSDHWVEAEVKIDGEIIETRLSLSWIDCSEDSQREAKDEILDIFEDLKEEETEWIF